MKKSSILILIAICLFSCSKPSKEASITGEIKGLGTDTLYLYGMDELRDRIDTIFTKDDKFAYTIPVRPYRFCGTCRLAGTQHASGVGKHLSRKEIQEYVCNPQWDGRLWRTLWLSLRLSVWLWKRFLLWKQ